MSFDEFKQNLLIHYAHLIIDVNKDCSGGNLVFWGYMLAVGAPSYFKESVPSVVSLGVVSGVPQGAQVGSVGVLGTCKPIFAARSSLSAPGLAAASFLRPHPPFSSAFSSSSGVSLHPHPPPSFPVYWLSHSQSSSSGFKSISMPQEVSSGNVVHSNQLSHSVSSMIASSGPSSFSAGFNPPSPQVSLHSAQGVGTSFGGVHFPQGSSQVLGPPSLLGGSLPQGPPSLHGGSLPQGPPHYSSGFPSPAGSSLSG